MILRLSWKRLDAAFGRSAESRSVMTVTDSISARQIRVAYRAMRRAGMDRTTAGLHITTLVCANAKYSEDPRQVSA